VLQTLGIFFEVGLTAFVERAHAFLGFLAHVEAFDGLDAEEADAADVFGIRVEGTLGDGDGAGAHLVDVGAPFGDFGVEFLMRHDLVDQAHLQRLGEMCIRDRPKSIDFVDEFPLTGTGKISKKDIRAPYWANMQRSVA